MKHIVSSVLIFVALLIVSAVDLCATTVALVSSANPATFGAPVTLTATVTPPSATGKVTFYNGVSILGTATLSGGTAALATVVNVTGSRLLTARYLGDGQNPPAISLPITVTVNSVPAFGFTSSNLNMGIVLYDAAAGDFNNDGRPDIVGVGSSNLVKVALGNGDGTFATPISTILPVGSTILGLVAIGDFNQDGNQDIALANSAANNVVVTFGNGSGGFSGTISLPTVAGSIVVADFNADGFPDLAVLHYLTNSVGILLGNGNGTFTAPTEYPFAPYMYNMVAGDVNNDGKVDLVTLVPPTQGNTREIVVLLGDGNGGFSAPIGGFDFNFTYNPWDSYALEDLNGDGKLDLVLAPGYGYQIGIFPGNGDGTFAQPVYYPVNNQYTGGAYGIAVVDFNGDGVSDVLSERGYVLNGQGENAFILYAGLGDGTVKPLGASPGSQGTPLNSWTAHTSLVLADFNRDGRIDVAAISNVGDSSIELLKGVALPLLQVSVNHNGSFVAGQVGATFTLSVSNVPGAAPTNGLVTVSNTVGVGMTFVSMSGSGWACSLTACTRSDALSPGSSYPPITLTVNVQASQSFPQVFDYATVSGGGSSVVADTQDVVAFQSPPVPVLTSPVNGATGISLNVSLAWNNVPSFYDVYDVYFGTSSTPPYVGTVTGLPYVPGKLTFGTVYYWRIVARNSAGSTSSAVWSFTAVSEGATAAVGSSPGSGSGFTQNLTFTFSDSSGWQDLSVVNLLVNRYLDGIGACYVAFAPASATSGYLYLVDDAGDGGYASGSPIALPSSSTLQNSQCTISGAGSSVVSNGNTLTLTLAVTFQSAFAGNQVFYMAARSNSQNSGWQAMGTWTVPGAAPIGPAVGGVNPARSSALSQTYSFTFSDTNGYADLAVVNVLINNFLDGIGACYVAFAPTSATSGYLYLVDDAGDGGYASGSPIALPSSGTLQNSQCTINATGSSVLATGNIITLNLAITFNQTFAGNQVFYLAARNNNTGNSGWQAVGSVTVP